VDIQPCLPSHAEMKVRKKNDSAVSFRPSGSRWCPDYAVIRKLGYPKQGRSRLPGDYSR
jgi:hypothetical protein